MWIKLCKNLSNIMKLPSNRNFGITFGSFFLIILIYFFYKYENLNTNVSLLILSLTFFILGVLNSQLLHPLNFIWFKFGIFLGKLISPLALFIIFYFIVTPTGIIMKILKRDLLNLKFNYEDSYWIKKKDYKSTMKKQF